MACPHGTNVYIHSKLKKFYCVLSFKLSAPSTCGQRCMQTTVTPQILAAIKFGVSQNKVIWQLLNLASPRGPSMQCTIDVYVGGDKY